MSDTDNKLKTSPLKPVPQELVSQLRIMRRNPDDFWVVKRIGCMLGSDRKGARSAYQIAHPSLDDAGTWCPEHGWIRFNSVKLPPTKNLTDWEIKDWQQSEQRRKAFAKRRAQD